MIINEISSQSNGKSESPRYVGGIREMFGAWNSGDPNSADNEKIDADLARAYADKHFLQEGFARLLA